MEFGALKKSNTCNVHSSKCQNQFTADTALAKTPQKLSIILCLLHIILFSNVSGFMLHQRSVSMLPPSENNRSLAVLVAGIASNWVASLPVSEVCHYCFAPAKTVAWQCLSLAVTDTVPVRDVCQTYLEKQLLFCNLTANHFLQYPLSACMALAFCSESEVYRCNCRKRTDY